ncbi:MAG: glycosyltransferase [Microgenomates group bacterium]
MKKIMVSVIIPTYNRDEPLRITLKSLFKQSYDNFEIIVVDQSDKKFPKKEKFLKKYSSKICYFSGLPPNAAAARNFGARKAKGKIFLFVDDDIEADKDLIINHLKNYQDKKVGAVVGRIVTLGQKEEPQRKNVGRITPWGSFTGGWSSKIKQEVFDAITCNASWRREVFEKIGGFDKNFSGPIREDSDLALRTIKAGYKIIFEPKAQLIHLRAESGGFRKTEGRLKWYFGFFKSEAYFAMKYIRWYWWSIFWLIRWQWFLRCMLGKERSWQSIITPFLGIKKGIKIGLINKRKLVKKIKRIGIDGGCLGVKDERLKVGVYQVAYHLLKEWGKLEDLKNTEFLIYSFLPIEKKILKEFGSNFKNIVIKPKKGWNWLWLPLKLLKDKPDLFLGLSQSLPKFLPCPGFVLVHDLSFEHYPACYPKSYFQLRRITQEAVKKAKKIIAVSKATKNDLIKFYKVPEEKIEVVYEGVDLSFKPAKKKSFGNYFLFVGALKPIKNIPRILKAYSLFLKETGKDIPFLFVGGDLWLDEEIKPTIKKLNLEKKVKFLGYIPKEKLIKLYQEALAFVSPSLYEGFGLTLLEAMACGCPVIAGNTGSQPEIVGKAGILVNPLNEKEISNAMIKVFFDNKFRQKLIIEGKQQVKNFLWKKFAEEIIKIFMV